MAIVLRPIALYFFLLIMMRLTGKRSLGEATAFDFVLLLILSETVSNAIVGDDNSLTAALVAFSTLLILDVLFSLVMRRWQWIARFVNEEPVVLVQEGRVLADRLRMERVERDDILEAAREIHGITRMDEIAYAILERGGNISIVPAKRQAV